MDREQVTGFLRQNWKFIASTLLSMVGVLLPLLLWQSEQKPLSLEAKVISIESMKFDGLSDQDDIKVVIGGEPVPSPFLSTLELVNSGKTPISAGDFHSPIVFSVGDGAKVIRAVVTSTNPNDIATKVTSAKESISLAPLLLNPGDTIRIAMITSTAIPKFSVHSRIAGIQRIVFEDTTQPRVRWLALGLGLVIGCAALTAYVVFLFGATANRVVELSRGQQLLVGALLGWGGVSALDKALWRINLDAYAMPVTIIVSLAAAAFISFNPRMRSVVGRLRTKGKHSN